MLKGVQLNCLKLILKRLYRRSRAIQPYSSKFSQINIVATVHYIDIAKLSVGAEPVAICNSEWL